MKSNKPKKNKKEIEKIEINIPPEGGEFSIDLMTGIVKQIFNYNPKTDTRDPLYGKEKNKKKK